MRRLLLLVLLVVGCSGDPEELARYAVGLEGATAAGGAGGWRLAGAYDVAPLLAVGDQPRDFLWRSAPLMEEFCGPSRRPMGLGVFEAEAIASGLSPTLALLLERTDKQALPPEDLRIAVGDADRKILLQPAVEPRHLTVKIEGTGPEVERYQQLVRTQLEIELCMEHKLGRKWTGADAALLREAFMLDPPGADSGSGRRETLARANADRMYFGGQGAAVPALLGPPDACLQRTPGLKPGKLSDAVVAGRDLVPSDVWSAGLRWCEADEQAGREVREGGGSLGLHLRLGAGKPAPKEPARWEELAVRVHGAEDAAGVTVDVVFGGRELAFEKLFQGAPTDDPQVESGGGGLVDVLARVPRRYPRLGSVDDPERYAVLLVPNWQLVDALRAIDTAAPESAQGAPDAAVRDGVAAVLARPELLFVQVPDPSAGPNTDRWLDLSTVMGPGPLRSRHWGYSVGYSAGRSPIALPGGAPDWLQEATAQRARPQAMFLLSAGLLLIALLVGLWRLPDLWARVPQIAMDYWPGAGLQEEESGNIEDAADAAAKFGNT
jgi:hypothetical protein